MSLYAQYIKEHRGDDIVETEYGFATYRYLDDYLKEKAVYIVDIYIIPEYRMSDHAGAIADEIVRVAKLRGYNKLLGTVVPTAKNSTVSLKVLLGYGMRLLSSSDNLITFEKDL